MRGYASHVVVTDGDAAFDTSAEVAAIVEANTAGAGFTLIWQRTVPAQQIIRWGSGSPNQQRNQGFMHFMAMDEGTGYEDGVIRLVVADAREISRIVVIEINTQRLHTTTFTTVITGTPTDINALYPLPLQVDAPGVQEDSLLQIYFRTTVATTTVDAVDFSIPVTIYQ
jgi:hypothetical protein